MTINFFNVNVTSLLATKLVDMWKHEETPSEFASVVEEHFAEFEFPDDFIFDIWGIIGDAKAGRL